MLADLRGVDPPMAHGPPPRAPAFLPAIPTCRGLGQKVLLWWYQERICTQCCIADLIPIRTIVPLLPRFNTDILLLPKTPSRSSPKYTHPCRKSMLKDATTRGSLSRSHLSSTRRWPSAGLGWAGSAGANTVKLEKNGKNTLLHALCRSRQFDGKGRLRQPREGRGR